MKLIKILSFFCAFLALLNTVDVHALGHLLDGDNHNQIENCDTCEEFVFSTYNEVSTTPETIITNSFIDFNFIEKPLLFSSRSIFINQEKHLGKFHNKPPPFTI
ncbi:hypothetical protein [Psychroflexus planctonicus]|uniref:hypothetical protein n=1 Tax=Psychroflexus planctonicus TaxID=1526575 RepID=UPI00166B8B69|nr:hypothetical protein [Psychroflexus planctonicus]